MSATAEDVMGTTELDLEEGGEVTTPPKSEKSKKPRIAKRVLNLSKEALITDLAEANPKREGSKAWDTFQLYYNLPENATIQMALDAGISMADIHYNIIHNFMTVAGTEVDEYTPGTRRGRQASAEIAVDSTEETDDEGLIAEAGETEDF